jgi:hypothetical protein
MSNDNIEVQAAAPEGLTTERPPVIPENATEDKPNDGSDALTAVDDPQGEWDREVGKTKLRFAIGFVIGCTGAAVALTLVQFFFQHWFPLSGGLATGIDLMKLLATTALGFVFGRTLDRNDTARNPR